MFTIALSVDVVTLITTFSYINIEEKYGREVRVVPTDFSKGEEIYPEIAEKLEDLDVGVLGE